MEEKIYHIKGVVLKKFKKGTKRLIDLSQCMMNNNRPVQGVININEIEFLKKIKVGDLVEIDGDFGPYHFANIRVDASSYHSNKKTEITVLSLKSLSIYNEMTGDLVEEITKEAYDKQVEDSHTKISHLSVPSVEEEEELKKL
jgi:TRAP-type uncharacterized transport system substrate-binding protein